ncbi:MAG: DUF2070 family protein [Nitrososphaerales archaeon]
MLRKSPTEDLSRRFKYIFSFPPQNAIFLLTLTSLIPTPLLILSSLGLTLIEIGFGILLGELALFLSIALERLTLRSRLANYRRLVGFSFITNFFLIFFALIAWISNLIVPSLARTVSLILLGIFFLAAFRIIIFRAIFTNSLIGALGIGALQPLFLFLAFLYFDTFAKQAFSLNLPYIFGISFLILSSLALKRLEDITSKSLPFNVFRFFKGFMLNWMESDSHLFEKYLAFFGKEREVKSYMIDIFTKNQKLSILVPGIHPGPLAGFGGSDLPYQIYSHLKKRAITSFILHGFSNHEYDLASKEELAKFISSLNDGEVISEDDRCAILRGQYGDIKATCINFNRVALLLITASPKCTDDFDPELEVKLKALLNLGYKELIAVDCHNSLNSEDREIEEKDVIKASELSLKGALNIKKFKIGVSHLSEIANKNFASDLGEAGMGLLLFDLEGERYCLIGIDANNAKVGLREEIEESLKSKGVKIAEVCTSDTHSQTGKASNKRGYYCFGELSDKNEIIGAIHELYQLALIRLEEAQFRVKLIKSRVKILGSDAWNYIATALERGISFSKRSSIIVGLLYLIFIATLIVFY